jgi:hypothetical protein
MQKAIVRHCVKKLGLKLEKKTLCKFTFSDEFSTKAYFEQNLYLLSERIIIVESRIQKQGDRLIPRCEGRAIMESRRNQFPLPPPLLESIAM